MSIMNAIKSIPMIQISEATKQYQTCESKDCEEIFALDKINLQIEKGEFVAIIGASGSGKSTLMNILGCLDVPTSGSYFLEGVDVCCKDDDELSAIRNQKIGFIFQGFHLIQSLTALENVELPLVYRKIKKTVRQDICKKALCHVGLEHRMNHLPSQMSGGQQQRVAIARAIAARPSILLADEPTGNLDKKAGNDVMNILLELNKEGKTIVLITHDNTIAHMAQRIIVMSDGRVVDAKQL